MGRDGRAARGLGASEQGEREQRRRVELLKGAVAVARAHVGEMDAVALEAVEGQHGELPRRRPEGG